MGKKTISKGRRPIKNTILMIKKRTFGPNINVNIILQKILIDNLSYFGLIPIMKHIPGHGVTNKDSHLTLPITKLSKSAGLVNLTYLT